MSSNPFRDRLAQLPKPPYRTDADRVGFPVRQVAMISARQWDYALDLLLSKDLTAERRPKFQARMCELAASRDLTKLTAAQVSALIDALLSLPSNRFPREQAAPMFRDEPVAAVPAGHYALDKADGGTMFVKVDRPESGKWAGYTFVSLQVSDELVRMPRNQQAAVLDAIRADGPREAAIRYGHELGVCSVCSRTLTNDESRAAGIGPTCRDKAGW